MITGECSVEGIPSSDHAVLLEGLRLRLDLRIVPRTPRHAAGGEAGAAAVWRIEDARIATLRLGVPTAYRRAAILSGVAVLALAIGVWLSRPSVPAAPDWEASGTRPAPGAAGDRSPAARSPGAGLRSPGSGTPSPRVSTTPPQPSSSATSPAVDAVRPPGGAPLEPNATAAAPSARPRPRTAAPRIGIYDPSADTTLAAPPAPPAEDAARAAPPASGASGASRPTAASAAPSVDAASRRASAAPRASAGTLGEAGPATAPAAPASGDMLELFSDTK